MQVSGWVSGFSRCALISLAGLLVVACQSKVLPDQRLARFVDEVIFGGPIDSHVPGDGGVVKWRGDVLVDVLGTDSQAYRPRVAAQIERISRLPGINARMADAALSANLEVTFVKTEDFLINREHVPCFAWVNEEAGRIVEAKVRISTADSDLIDHCLSHELMHAFGLLFHSGIVRSSLSPAHEEAQPTPWDELALRVLYDNRLEIGAGRAVVAPMLQEIVSEFIAGS